MKLNFPQSTTTSEVHRGEEQTYRRGETNCGVSENTFEASSNENGLFRLIKFSFS